MLYTSTRNNNERKTFKEAILQGLSNDGGLYIPVDIPQFTTSQISAMQSLSYEELAFTIISSFTDEKDLPHKDLKRIINKSYSNFHNKAIAPIVQIDRNDYILELFHGPTLAFKDFALQFLGNLLEFFLGGKKAIILGATSGDTGSAAIMGCMKYKNAGIFILHPHNKISSLQRKQMTTTGSDNVFNLAVEGNFDDCQLIVKNIFNSQLFKGKNLIAVNSINWARILAQVVYYFYSALSLGSPTRSISFVVPTGNFGNIYAGIIARKMGLPIDKFIVATNENDILHRFFEKNDYSRKELKATFSPSMDIQVSSNFERFISNLYDNDSKVVKELMNNFHSTNIINLSDFAFQKAQQYIISNSATNEETIAKIASVYDENNIILDPHTAVAVVALDKSRNKISKNSANIILATAHPAKFIDTILESGIAEENICLPPALKNITNKQENYNVIANNTDKVVEFILSNNKDNNDK